MTLSVVKMIPGLGGRERRVAMLPAPRPSSRRRARAQADILGEGLFRDAVVRERKRADRYDTPFSVLLVDAGSASREADFWSPVLRAVVAVKRDVDAVGWFEQGEVLGLLLPDAAGKGALKVVRQLQRELARRLGETAPAALSIRLYAHGDPSDAEGDGLPTVDLLVEAFITPRARRWREAAKRGLDIVGSLGLLALFAPILLGVSLAVKWTSPGPVLYRQIRVGRREEPFTMLKFRTMHAGADHAIHQDYVNWFITSSGRQPRKGDEVFKLTDDPRITPVGHFLRRTSLDELPQFWNVLRGDMSLVGPRPPLPFEVERYQPWHRRRVLEAKPGITGLWQVEGRSRTTFDEMVRLDLQVRQDAHAVDRHQDPGRDAAGHGLGERRLLMDDKYLAIAPDVKLGKDVKLARFVNLYGCEVGDETKIGTFVEIQKNAVVGRRCKISSHTFICEGVTIEDNVFIGHGVTFINDSYPRATTAAGGLQTEADWKVEKTLVRKGASIGSGATIMCRVTIGEHAIVGAGSVVTRNVPARCIVWGNPAKVLRRIAVDTGGAK